MRLQPEPAAHAFGASDLPAQKLGQRLTGPRLELGPGGGVGIDHQKRRIGNQDRGRIAFGKGADRRKAARVATPPEAEPDKRERRRGREGRGRRQHAGAQHRLLAQHRGKPAGQRQRRQKPGAAQNPARPARPIPLCRRDPGHIAPPFRCSPRSPAWFKSVSFEPVSLKFVFVRTGFARLVVLKPVSLKRVSLTAVSLKAGFPTRATLKPAAARSLLALPAIVLPRSLPPVSAASPLSRPPTRQTQPHAAAPKGRFSLRALTEGKPRLGKLCRWRKSAGTTRLASSAGWAQAGAVRQAR